MLKSYQTSKLQNKTVVVIGLGLIGGSLAKALHQSNIFKDIIGCDQDVASLVEGVSLGVISRYEEDVCVAVAQADIVVLALPILSVESVLAEIQAVISPHAVITDVGSSKASVVQAVRKTLGKKICRFVPGHPIAGSEKSGVSASNEHLFAGQKIILTPLQSTDADAKELVSLMWLLAGATVVEMGVERHDQVLAVTSHLPHLLAYSLVDTLATQEDNLDVFRYAAGGFRDFTRIAASDPVMWRDIFTANKGAVLEALDLFTKDLSVLRRAIVEGDSPHMIGVFTRAKSARDHFTKMLSQKAYLDPMQQNEKVFIARPGGTVTGEVRVPGDKSISHRSIMLGSLADGVTEVEGFLEGEDSLATLQAFRDMGVVIDGPHHGRVTIYGVGMHGLKQPPGPLYVGNSGTSMRLLVGLLASQSFDVELAGDESLTKRPMNRVANPLREMGAVIETADEGRPPLKIKGGQALKGIHYDLPMASAQVKSCVLLAGLNAEGETSVTEPAPTRDHTERMLSGFGYTVQASQTDNDGKRTLSLTGGGSLTAGRIDVPADISSATFFMVAASITPDSNLLLKHVGINPTREGVINILRLMGANLVLENERQVGGEPVADIRVRYAPLKGIHIPEDQVPLAIDEFPALFIAAACADGTTVLTGAEELRVKESDRIQAMADGLVELGVKAEAQPDGIVIQGGVIGGGEVESHGDHRIAMSFAVAALRASGEIRIKNCANVATSFPNFVGLAQEVGMQLVEEGA